jgi:hypothetical protein
MRDPAGYQRKSGEITMQSSFRNLLPGLLLALMPVFVAAQQPAVAPVDLKYEIEAARNKMEKELRIILATELRLTPKEKEAFWPIFNEYFTERRKIGDMRVKLILDYSENYDRMTEQFADRMLDDFIQYNSDLLKLHKKYMRRFKGILPSTKVARLFQVQNKLDAVVNFNLAARIPLVQ